MFIENVHAVKMHAHLLLLQEEFLITFREPQPKF